LEEVTGLQRIWLGGPNRSAARRFAVGLIGHGMAHLLRKPEA
jgi:hypothetical protein